MATLLCNNGYNFMSRNFVFKWLVVLMLCATGSAQISSVNTINTKIRKYNYEVL